MLKPAGNYVAYDKKGKQHRRGLGSLCAFPMVELNHMGLKNAPQV
jgi:hypothetical protein